MSRESLNEATGHQIGSHFTRRLSRKVKIDPEMSVKYSGTSYLGISKISIDSIREYVSNSLLGKLD